MRAAWASGESTRFVIRSARSADLPGMYRVCLQTGDDGADGTRLYPDDPDALGRIFVGPYVSLEPDSSLVLEDEEGIAWIGVESETQT